MKVQSFVVSPFSSNCYVLSVDEQAGSQAVVIDPGDLNLASVLNYIAAHKLDVQAVWNTHAHLDHVMGVDVIRSTFGVPAFVHQADLPWWVKLTESAQGWLGMEIPALRPPDGVWQEGDVVSLGTQSFTIWHTPGHSPGSICLVGTTLAFTGDTLFAGSIGRTDLPLSDPQAMQASLHKLLTLPDELALFPGHMGPTTMQRERDTNPFLRSAK